MCCKERLILSQAISQLMELRLLPKNLFMDFGCPGRLDVPVILYWCVGSWTHFLFDMNKPDGGWKAEAEHIESEATKVESLRELLDFAQVAVTSFVGYTSHSNYLHT